MLLKAIEIEKEDITAEYFILSTRTTSYVNDFFLLELCLVLHIPLFDVLLQMLNDPASGSLTRQRDRLGYGDARLPSFRLRESKPPNTT